MNKRALAVAASLIFTLLSAHAASASLLLTCYLGYLSSTSSASGAYLSTTPRDRNCTFYVAFKDPNNSQTFAGRSYSCHIAASSSYCQVSVDPSASGVPSTYVVVSANTPPLYSSTEEADGCSYAQFQHTGSILPQPYPITFTDPSPATPTPTSPYIFSSSDPMPAYPVAGGPGSLQQIVALHYFDCSSHP